MRPGPAAVTADAPADSLRHPVDRDREAEPHERGRGTDLTYRIQFWDKLKAIELEYKRFGLLKDLHEHTHRVTLEALVAARWRTWST